MKRRLLNRLTLLSLLLATAVAVLWVRGRAWTDTLYWGRASGDSYEIRFSGGTVELSAARDLETQDAGAGWDAFQVPSWDGLLSLRVEDGDLTPVLRVVPDGPRAGRRRAGWYVDSVYATWRDTFRVGRWGFGMAKQTLPNWTSPQLATCMSVRAPHWSVLGLALLLPAARSAGCIRRRRRSAGCSAQLAATTSAPRRLAAPSAVQSHRFKSSGGFSRPSLPVLIRAAFIPQSHGARMTQPDAAAGTDVRHSRPAQGVVALASGLLVIFAAFGFGAWFSGLASWVGFYLGARGRTLTGLAQWTACVGFALAVVVTLTWYARRCRRGATDISLRTVLVACLVLPVGNICWAIFADAIAYHYGQDVVRPAFDLAVMYLMLGGLLPLAVGVPWQVMRLQRRYAPRAAGPDPAAG